MGIAARRIGDEAEDLTATGVRPRVERQAPDLSVSELQRNRAKRLPLHLSNVATLSVAAIVEPAPEQVHVVRLRSAARVEARTMVARLLDAILVRGGLSNSDLGAALDVSAERARRMRSGEAPFEVAHALLAASRLPSVREQLLELLAASVGGAR